MTEPSETRATRSVDVHYRKLDRENAKFPDQLSFAEALRGGLQHQVSGIPVSSNVLERVQSLIPDKPGDVRCWNNVSAGDGFVFGTLCLYRPYELQALIKARTAQSNLSAFPLEEINSVSGSDFLKAIAYWMATEDHFYLIQSSSIQTSIAESYFTWLLRKVGTLTGEQRVLFQVALDRDAVGGDLEDLRSISIGGQFNNEDVASEHRKQEKTKSKVGVEVAPAQDAVERRRVGGRPILPNGWEVLHRLVQDDRSLAEIEEAFRELRQTDPQATLDAELEFFVRVRSRKPESSAARQRALQAISSGLRDMPDGAVTARGRDGIMSGSEIRLKMPRRIAIAPVPNGAPEGARSSLLDLDDTFKNMKTVHQRFLEDGKI